MDTGDGETWRNQGKVQVIAAIDVLLSSGLILLYLYYSVCFLGGLSPLPAAELSVHLGRALVLLVGVLVFLVNGNQIRVAVQLLKSLYPDPPSIDQSVCSNSARLWLHTSIALLLVLAVKFFLLTLIPLGETNNLDYFLTLVEFLFRVLGVYFVKELLDDLRAATLIRGVESSKGKRVEEEAEMATPSTKRRVNRQHASIEIPLDEIISNTTMKIVINTSRGEENTIPAHKEAQVQVVEEGAGEV